MSGKGVLYGDINCYGLQCQVSSSSYDEIHLQTKYIEQHFVIYCNIDFTLCTYA